MISIFQLGTVDYATALSLQQRLVALRKENKIGDVLLLLEHKPVITLGRNAKAVNIVASPELLAQRGVEVFECDRGGDVTLHAPGQLVGYPIFDLRGYANAQSLSSRASRSEGDGESRDLASPARKHLGAVDFVRRLEEVLIRTCADFALETKRIPGLTGVWTNPNPLSSPAQSRDLALVLEDDAKLAAIGIHISRYVTSHGFALNVNTDLSYFNLIIPCGITTRPVTAMERELNQPVDMNAVAESISRNFGKVFSTQILWLESLDALLGHTVGVPMKLPAELRRIHKEDDTTWA